jgi:hemolysin III
MDGNLVYEEVFNSLTHGIGIVLALIGIYFMTMKAAEQNSVVHTFGASIFSFAVLMLYTSSCLFHSFFKLGMAKIVFQVMDHLAIFVMIAGTYTPVLMIPLHGPHAYLLLAVLWTVALIGIAQVSGTLFFFPLPSKFCISPYILYFPILRISTTSTQKVSLCSLWYFT